MLRTRAPLKPSQPQQMPLFRYAPRDVHEVLVGAPRPEPEEKPFDQPCRGGAWGERTECLTHEGARINPRTGVCESVSGEEGF